MLVGHANQLYMCPIVMPMGSIICYLKATHLKIYILFSLKEAPKIDYPFTDNKPLVSVQVFHIWIYEIQNMHHIITLFVTSAVRKYRKLHHVG